MKERVKRSATAEGGGEDISANTQKEHTPKKLHVNNKEQENRVDKRQHSNMDEQP